MEHLHGGLREDGSAEVGMDDDAGTIYYSTKTRLLKPVNFFFDGLEQDRQG